MFTKRVVLFLLRQNLSIFGSSVVGFAIIWYITLETSSGIYLMLATLAQMVPHLLISLYSGVWADRHSRKILIMLSDSFIAVATLVLALIFSLGLESIWAILAVSVIRSIGSGVQSPAVNAIIPQLVAEEHLVRIQGINQSINSALMLLSPAVGGMMLGLFGLVSTFYLDVVTATLAVLVFSFIKVSKPKQSELTHSVVADIKVGISYTFSHPILRNLLICYGFSFFLITPAAILTPLLVERTFGSEDWLLPQRVVWPGGALFGAFGFPEGNFKNKVTAISLPGGLRHLLCLAWRCTTFLLSSHHGLGGNLFPPQYREFVMIQETPMKTSWAASLPWSKLSGSAIPLASDLRPLGGHVSIHLYSA